MHGVEIFSLYPTLYEYIPTYIALRHPIRNIQQMIGLGESERTSYEYQIK